MSAGIGVQHSEFNPSKSEEVSLFQIWIFPEERDVEPRYDQRDFDESLYKDDIVTLVNNEKDGDTLFIHQKAAVSLSKPSAGKTLTYASRYEGNGVYIMLIDGQISVAGNSMKARDAVGVWETKKFNIILNIKL